MSGLTTSLALAFAAPALASAQADIVSAKSVFPDRCVEAPGYAEFRAKLRDAVQRRDAKALQGLFAAQAGMRVNGVGGRGSPADWRLETRGLAEVWRDLEQILALGCYSEEGRLYLPFTASLAEKNPESEVTVTATDLRSAPTEDSSLIASVSPGTVLPRYNRFSPDWIEVTYSDDIVWVRRSDVRAPADTVLTVGLEHGTLRIIWYGGND